MTGQSLAGRDLKDICVSTGSTIRDALVCIDKNSIGIAFVVDEEMRLVGTVTDGDIRRAMLTAHPLNAPVKVLLASKSSDYVKPVTAPVWTGRQALLDLMLERDVSRLPLLDAEGRLQAVVLREDLLATPHLPVDAIIMAGGEGTRLRPLTNDTPKPMLPVGGRPLLEIIVGQLREAGISRIYITTCYKSEKITEHFGNGDRFGVDIQYINEEKPMGTGGALGMLPELKRPIILVNGDILTLLNFRALYDYHIEQKSDLTVAVRGYSFKVPYGVVECDESNILRLQEKPELNFLVNAGIYLVSPSIFDYIPRREPFNMTDLMQWLLDKNKRLVSFHIHEYWLDIGHHADYAKAQKDILNEWKTP